MLEMFLDYYNHVMIDLRDPRADSYPFMSSMWPTAFACIAYVYFCKVLGPRMMENREPFQLKGVILAYNLFQTLFSAWGFSQGWKFYVSGSYSLTCEPIDYSNDPEAIRALNLAWIFYISKFIDFADSIFFVLKKKFTHLSFLHVFHHGIMPFQTWWGPRFVGGGHGGFAAFFNAGVHTVMYLYYFLSAFGPKMQPFLWWKRYLTRLQMVQFVCVFFHALLPLVLDCGYPKIVPLAMCANAVAFFVLFANFYFFAYVKKHQDVKKEEVTRKNV